MHVDEGADFRSMGQSNRPLDAQVRAAGKGDDRRPAQIAAEELGKRWCQTFGHRFVDGRCVNGCGASGKTRQVRRPTTKQIRRTA